MDPRPYIVVVEDEAAQRQLLADYLARQSFRVSALGDGAALRRLVERELPALVMLDVGLPGEDGFALARWLREKSGRVGINVGDVLADGEDILGDSVNIAARLEGIAEPGGICLSAAAYEQVRGKLEIAIADMGEQDLKNIARPLRTYRVVL